MTYAEKMTMKIMGEMSYNYGNQPATLKIVNQIMADTKRACKQEIKKQIEKLNPEAVVYLAGIFDAQYLIDQAEVKEDKR